MYYDSFLVDLSQLFFWIPTQNELYRADSTILLDQLYSEMLAY